MTIDMGVFTAAMNEAKKEVTDTALDVLKKVAIQVDQAVVLATPRDTGRAASNWLPSLNIPITSAREGAGGVGSALGEAIGVISEAKLGDAIYFTNNLPYIGVLNDGSSTQAPAGFVEKAALAAQSSLVGV